MKKFVIKNAFSNNNKEMHLSDDQGQFIAEIRKAEEPGFAFVVDHKAMMEQHFFGKKEGMIYSSYHIRTSEDDYTLQDDTLKSFLGFSVEGKIDELSVLIEEDWEEQIELKIENKRTALIKPKMSGFGATIRVDEGEYNLDFVLTLVCFSYLMWKIYHEDSDFLGSLFDEE